MCLTAIEPFYTEICIFVFTHFTAAVAIVNADAACRDACFKFVWLDE